MSASFGDIVQMKSFKRFHATDIVDSEVTYKAKKGHQFVFIPIRPLLTQDDVMAMLSVANLQLIPDASDHE